MKAIPSCPPDPEEEEEEEKSSLPRQEPASRNFVAAQVKNVVLAMFFMQVRKSKPSQVLHK